MIAVHLVIRIAVAVHSAYLCNGRRLVISSLFLCHSVSSLRNAPLQKQPVVPHGAAGAYKAQLTARPVHLCFNDGSLRRRDLPPLLAAAALRPVLFWRQGLGTRNFLAAMVDGCGGRITRACDIAVIAICGCRAHTRWTVLHEADCHRSALKPWVSPFFCLARSTAHSCGVAPCVHRVECKSGERTFVSAAAAWTSQVLSARYYHPGVS